MPVEEEIERFSDTGTASVNRVTKKECSENSAVEDDSSVKCERSGSEVDG